MSASKSEQVYRAILARIKEGFWKRGEQILSERQLSELFSVSRVTVRNALSQLVGEGILEYREGRLGTFVAQQAEEEKANEANFIGIALDNYTPAFASFLLEGIHDALWKQGYHTLYCNTHFSDGVVLDKISSFIDKGVKGLIPRYLHWQSVRDFLLYNWIGLLKAPPLGRYSAIIPKQCFGCLSVFSTWVYSDLWY
jgi:DNA-binding transcriptional regulator YhcF (GntR family)